MTACANHPDRPALARGLCGGCYSTARRLGALPPRKLRSATELLAEAREGRGDDECWPWPGNISHDGYGRVRIDGVLWIASRWAWTEHVGEIAEGLHVDHGCHNRSACRGGPSCPHRRCVNYLRHLEPVTTQVNVARAAGRLLPTCRSGHEMTEANTWWYRTKRDGRRRRCRLCTLLSNARSAQRALQRAHA